MINPSKNIERFEGYFHRQLVFIDCVKVDHVDDAENHYEQVYKKLLYSAFLDAISKVIYPHKGNRDRVVSFLIKFSDWNDCTKISFPHLARILQIRPEPEYEKLREFVFREYTSKWQAQIAKPRYLSTDPEFGLVQKLWPPLKEHKGDDKIPGLKLEELQHSSLFYSYRNSLVHELRPKGDQTPDIWNIDEPYYKHVSIISGARDEIGQSWELTYPADFFKRIAQASLENTSQYLKRNFLDPFASFDFGAYWIEELND